MKLKSKINTSIKGRFGVSVLDSEGNPVEGKQYKDISNFVSYDGAAKVFTAVNESADINDGFYSQVGTSTTERTRNSTGLGSPLAPVSATDSPARSTWGETDNLDGTVTYEKTHNMSFSLGAIDATISEVGLFCSDGDFYFAGQLIKDELGDPTTVTVLSDEQLVVTYTIEFTVPLAGTLIGSGTVDADGTSTDYEIYAQPLFARWELGQTSATSNRYSADISRCYVVGSNGTTLIAQKNTSGTVSHDGSGTVTYNNSSITFSPSDFSSSDVAYISIATGTSFGDIDTGTVTEESGTFNGAVVICAFDPVISKPADKTLTFEIDFDVTV